MPVSKPNLVTGDIHLIVRECESNRLLRNQAAYVLATALWETAYTMKPVREAYWLSEGWRRRNLRYYPWYGRGYVQLTWKRNYEYAGGRLGLDLTTNPDVVMERTTAARILVVGMKEGWFTGKKLSDYITRQQSHFQNARRIVNGMDKSKEIAALAQQYDKYLLEKGYGVLPMLPTPSIKLPRETAIALIAATIAAGFVYLWNKLRGKK